jgi:segregation and condensation protein B
MLESSPDRGLSLDQLKGAFAEMLGTGDDPYAETAPHEPVREVSLPGEAFDPVAADDRVEVTPRSIVEAMLFVGMPNDQPLTAARMASLMRGVRPAEIDDLVQELNAQYEARGCPYRIASVGDGYTLALREEFEPLRSKVLTRVRQVRLSRAAIEVLSLVAYRGPINGDAISKLRGAPSTHILAQLVRRRLLSIERTTGKTRPYSYRVTDRFLQLFGLSSLEDLPRSQDMDVGGPLSKPAKD